MMRIAHQLNEWRKIYWHRLYSFVSYSRSALWIIPLIAILLVLILARVALKIDVWLDWDRLSLSPLDLDGAKALYQTVITLNVSFLVFTFGSLLVAIQVASGQMTPRVIATTLLRDNTVRYTVGLFVFTLLFANNALMRTEATVHQIVTVITGVLGLTSLAAFLFFIDYAARLLRPGRIVTKIADAGLDVIQAIYPLQDTYHEVSLEEDPKLGLPSRILYHQGQSATVLAVNVDELIAEAQRSSGVVEFIPRVGDFIATDEPLFRLYYSSSFDENRLQGAVAVGPERTLEQDPLFAFRILLDIALKALSKAINDPTTATLAIDQLHRLLRAVGKRKLSSEQILDGKGQLRVIFRTPNWEDYVRLTFTELRFNGVESIQVVRRLRALIEDLLKTLPEHRRPALHRELELLDLAVQRVYTHPEDLALARTPDSQGLGGSSRSKAA